MPCMVGLRENVCSRNLRKEERRNRGMEKYERKGTGRGREGAREEARVKEI